MNSLCPYGEWHLVNRCCGIYGIGRNHHSRIEAFYSSAPFHHVQHALEGTVSSWSMYLVKVFSLIFVKR